MSFEAMTWAAKQKTGDPASKLILLLLANYAGDDFACWPSHKTLADSADCSVRSIVRHIAVLEELGLVVRDERRRSDGTRSSDLITLCMPKPEATLPIDQDAKLARRKTPRHQGAKNDQQDANLSKVTCQIGIAEPINEPITEPSSTPAASIEDDFDFEDMLSSYHPHDPDDNLRAARKVFAELTIEERAQAVRAAPDACKRAKEAGKTIPYLISYLRDRKFRSASGAPVPCEYVLPGSPRWDSLIAGGVVPASKMHLSFVPSIGREAFVYYPQRRYS